MHAFNTCSTVIALLEGFCVLSLAGDEERLHFVLGL
jgi:hypothetical protein